MSQLISDRTTMIAAMNPVLHPGAYAFVSVQKIKAEDLDVIIATMREPEGVTLIMREEDARQRNLSVAFRAAWLTLSVHSDLNGIGLTAAFAGALAQAGISCNVVAGVCHDHLFVPLASGEKARVVLRNLQILAAEQQAARNSESGMRRKMPSAFYAPGRITARRSAP